MRILKKLIIIGLVFLMTACSEIKQYTSYTIYPIGYLLNRIGGNRIITTSIQNNVQVEKATPVDNFTELINDSIFLFHIADLEPYLALYEDDIIESQVEKVDLSLLNSIYKFQRYTRVSTGNQETYIESPYYEGDVFNDIDTFDDDLYLWLDPSGMLSMAKDVYDVLSSNYVEQSSYFKENYDSLYSDLTSLEAAYQSLSLKLKKENKIVKFVSMTPAFGSWQKSYGFNVYPVCLSKYGTLPTDEQLTIIKQRIIDDEVKYIVYEPNMSEDMYNLFKSLEDELGLKRVNLSNISSLTQSQSDDGKDYLSIMYENLNVLENIAVNVVKTVEVEDTNDIEIEGEE